MNAIPHSSMTRRRRTFVIIVLLLLINLACVDIGADFVISPRDSNGANVVFTYSMTLTDDYIQAAERATIERAQDYTAAGEPVPEFGFPLTWTELMEISNSDPLPDKNMVITHEDEKGFIAETTYTVSSNSSTLPDAWSLHISEIDENGAQTYTYEVQTPEVGKDFDYPAFQKMITDPMPPKPPVKPPEPDAGGDGGLGGLFSAMSDIMEGTLDATNLETWYLRRILKETGFPVYTYSVTMPGKITSHTVEGQEVGTLSNNGRTVTLNIDDAFFKRFGVEKHMFRVETQVSQCESECAAQPYKIWDRSASGSGCTCICESGYESDNKGDCISCSQICTAHDPLAITDPTASQPNNCACTCTGKLMEFSWGEDDGECRCITGAERNGNQCECKTGYTLNTDGTQCLEDKKGDESQIENCLSKPDEYQCSSSQVCDPLNPAADKQTGCTAPHAYIFVGTDIKPSEYKWIAPRIKNLRVSFQEHGYTVGIVDVKDRQEFIKFLARPSTRAIAFFGHAHAGQVEIEDFSAAEIRNKVRAELLERYQAMGYSEAQAITFMNIFKTNRNLDAAYIQICYSAQDMTLRDYLVKPGGIYWGSPNVHWAAEHLDVYRVPGGKK